MKTGRKQGGRWRGFLRGVVRVLAIGYPLSLVLVILALRLLGDYWWVTSVALYLPRLGFALPFPFIVLLLVITRRWRLLGLQAVSLWLLLFPLFGLSLSWRGYPAQGERTFRVLTYNVDSGNGGTRAIVDEILAHSPDLVFLQELPPWSVDKMKAELAPSFPNIAYGDQFLVATRFRIISSNIPPRIPFSGRDRTPRFMRFVIDTPLGAVTVVNLHTVSPRGAFYKLRGKGLRHEILSGHLLSGESAPEIEETATLRTLQVKAAAALAASEKGPAMIVGDANLPTLSPVRARYLGDFHDGFAEAGLGFGWSYPAKFPWMRIDLLLSNDLLAFKRVELGAGRASDHVCLFGDVVARR